MLTDSGPTYGTFHILLNIYHSLFTDEKAKLGFWKIRITLWKHAIVDKCMCMHKWAWEDFLHENVKETIEIEHELFIKM